MKYWWYNINGELLKDDPVEVDLWTGKITDAGGYTYFDTMSYGETHNGEKFVPVKDEEMEDDGFITMDNVSNPSHYNTSGIECIQAIKAMLTEEEFRGYIKGNALKYLWRERYKNQDEDLNKAEWYLHFLNKGD